MTFCSIFRLRSRCSPPCMAISRRNAFHALLYLVVSLLAVAVIFLSMAATFAAVLEIIVYAGAIIVLFIFVVMMLNLGKRAGRGRGRTSQTRRCGSGPGILALVLLAELAFVSSTGAAPSPAGPRSDPRRSPFRCSGPIVIGVELASFLLLAGLVGAVHLGSGARSTEATSDGRDPPRTTDSSSPARCSPSASSVCSSAAISSSSCCPSRSCSTRRGWPSSSPAPGGARRTARSCSSSSWSWRRRRSPSGSRSCCGFRNRFRDLDGDAVSTMRG